LGVSEQFEEQQIVGNAVKGLDNVQEDDGELFVFVELRVRITEKTVDVVEGGELFAKTRLVAREERGRIKVGHEAVVDDTFEKTHDDTGDADEPVG